VTRVHRPGNVTLQHGFPASAGLPRAVTTCPSAAAFGLASGLLPVASTKHCHLSSFSKSMSQLTHR
jgi:hypothetical protein